MEILTPKENYMDLIWRLICFRALDNLLSLCESLRLRVLCCFVSYIPLRECIIPSNVCGQRSCSQRTPGKLQEDF
jgi:hypothetical protein